MGNCNDKIKIRCKQQSAECVKYERDLPEFSELEDCVTIAETTEELYNLVGDIKEEIDLTGLLPECLTLPTPLTVKSMFQFLISTICDMKETISDLQAEIVTINSEIDDLQTNPCP